MVSAIDSTRLVSAQYALKNLRGSDDDSSQSATESSGAASILSSYGLDPDTSSLLSNNALASLLDTLSTQNDQTRRDDGHIQRKSRCDEFVLHGHAKKAA